MKNKMNKKQIEFLKSYTCGILEKYEDIDAIMKSHGIQKKHIKKMNNAFDLIFEVNQSCFAKGK